MRSTKLELASVGAFALTGSQGMASRIPRPVESVWSEKGVMK
jgi:hypothetical protein